MNEAYKPNPFYPIEFLRAAVAILHQDFQLDENDISLDNAEMIYVHITNKFS